jgi:aconitase A
MAANSTMSSASAPNCVPSRISLFASPRATGATEDVPVTCRIDTPIEIDYYQHGGILPYVLRQLVSR